MSIGEIVDGKMKLNRYGEIVEQQRLWLEKQYPYVLYDEWAIMPNHVHGIVQICRERSRPFPTIKIKSLSEIIGAFKTTSSKMIHLNGCKFFKWQKSFYDQIIRDRESLEKIRWYVENNPKTRGRDRNNLVSPGEAAKTEAAESTEGGNKSTNQK